MMCLKRIKTAVQFVDNQVRVRTDRLGEHQIILASNARCCKRVEHQGRFEVKIGFRGNFGVKQALETPFLALRADQTRCTSLQVRLTKLQSLYS